MKSDLDALMLETGLDGLAGDRGSRRTIPR